MMISRLNWRLLTVSCKTIATDIRAQQSTNIITHQWNIQALYLKQGNCGLKQPHCINQFNGKCHCKDHCILPSCCLSKVIVVTSPLNKCLFKFVENLLPHLFAVSMHSWFNQQSQQFLIPRGSFRQPTELRELLFLSSCSSHSYLESDTCKQSHLTHFESIHKNSVSLLTDHLRFFFSVLVSMNYPLLNSNPTQCSINFLRIRIKFYSLIIASTCLCLSKGNRK